MDGAPAPSTLPKGAKKFKLSPLNPPYAQEG
jgi:hypothetical protein